MVSGETSKAYIRAAAWSENNQDMVVSQGDTFTVDCHAWGYITPDVKWYKDGKDLTPDGSHVVFEDKPALQKNIILKNGRVRINKATSQILVNTSVRPQTFSAAMTHQLVFE